ncbi:MAG: M56 family metallopeptidase [Gemmatimonadetes bacterium]|nr:M56 family metallopeptidase [Gemmatimonadota bacterium]
MLYVLDWALKASLLLGAAGVLTAALRNRPASLRHLVWTFALAGALLVPPLSLLVPAWRPVPRDVGLPAPLSGVRASQLPLLGGVGFVPPSLAAASGRLPSLAVAGDGAAPASAQPSVSGQAGPIVRQPASVASEYDAGSARFRLSVPWTSLALPVWAMGVAAMLLLIASGTRRTARLARRAARIETGPVARLATTLASRLGVRGQVIVLRGHASAMPMTWGILRPVILLPAAADEWPEDRLRAVLLHELGHVKRHDCLTQLIARLACAVYWFNPIVWLAALRLRVERELACDDLVIATGSRATAYATHLVDVARALRTERLAAVAAIALARRSHLSSRVTALLDPARERGVARAALVLPAGIVAALLVLPLAGVELWRETDEQPAIAATTSPVTTSTGVASASVAVAAPDRSLIARLRAEVRDLQGRPARLVANVRGLATTAWSALSTWSAPPARAVQGCSWDSERNTSASVNVDDDGMFMRIRVGNCRLEVQSEGEVTFTDDDRDVASIAGGGSFEIEERDGQTTRRLEIRPGTGGSLERRFLVDGDVRPYDAEASEWLAHTLPVMFRRTGFDAEARAERILRRGGMDGLLAEIALIKSDWAARQYYAVLLSQRNVDAAVLRQVVQQARRDIESDFELAELLVAVAERQPLDEHVRVAYVEATHSIESSFERRRALSAVLGRQELSDALAAAMLVLAGDIESDFELAELLIEILEARPVGAAPGEAFWQAVDSIESSFERRRVLNAVVDRSGGNQVVLDQALEAGIAIDSDFEQAELLITVAGLYPAQQALPDAYLRAAAQVESGFERRRVLQNVVERAQVSSAQLNSALAAAKDLSSSFELAELLIAVVEHHGLSDGIRPAFFAAVSGIDSDFERARVLKAAVLADGVTEATVAAVLEAAPMISSDFELATLLVTIARKHRIGNTLRPAFLKAADRIESEFERGRVLSALYRRGEPAD